MKHLAVSLAFNIKICNSPKVSPCQFVSKRNIFALGVIFEQLSVDLQSKKATPQYPSQIL